MHGEGGIIVDSYLTFPDETGEEFIATAEATSVETREEVKYSVQYRLLFWDSLVFGTLITILYFGITHFSGFLSMPALSPFLRASSLLAAVMLFTFLYYKEIRPLKRYRYIYAIAQFKKYHANEQWVAIAKGVFPKLDEDTYYRELKRQCTRFGFGLILIDNYLQPRLILSPSRKEQFARQRQRIRFLPRQLFAGIQPVKRENWKVFKWWDKWTNPYRKHDYLRFKSGFNNQLALIALGLTMILLLFYQEKSRLPIYYPNEALYALKLENQAKKEETENANIDDPTPFVVPFGEPVTEDQLLGWEAEEEPEIITIEPEAKVMVYDPYNQNVILYDCERMYNFTDTKYIIEIGVYPDPLEARNNLEIYGDAGINGIVFWEGCFSPNAESFVLYIETMHDSLREAENALDLMKRKLLDADLNARIRPITPLINQRY